MVKYRQPPYVPPRPPRLIRSPGQSQNRPVRSPGTAPYMPPEKMQYVPTGMNPSFLGYFGAFMVFFGTILIAIPALWMASLPEDITESDMQIMYALPGIGWIVIGLGVLLVIIGLTRILFMK